VTYLILYVAGVLIGLVVMRDPWGERLGTALMWPLGPIAFAVVVPMMLIAAAILWPAPMLGGAAMLALIAYLAGC
jgi:hypothetical protein